MHQRQFAAGDAFAAARRTGPSVTESGGGAVIAPRERPMGDEVRTT